MAKTKTTSRTRAKAPTSNKSMRKSQGARATKPGHTKRGGASPPKSVGDEEVSIDRRRGERRGETDEQAAAPTQNAPQLERRKKVNRRRQIDPTTCERDYTDNEVEFMNALDDYKRKSGRMFPTCSEVLEVLRGLGYVKLSPAEFAARPEASAAASAKPMPSDWQDSDAASSPRGSENSALELEPEWAC